MLVLNGFSHKFLHEHTSTQALKRDHIGRSMQKILWSWESMLAMMDQNLLSHAKGPGCLGYLWGGYNPPVLWGLYYTVMSSMTGPLSYEKVHTRVSRTKPSWWTDGPAFGILLCSSVIETNGWCRWPLRSENKKPGCLGYMADSTTQFYRALYETLIYKHPY